MPKFRLLMDSNLLRMAWTSPFRAWRNALAAFGQDRVVTQRNGEIFPTIPAPHNRFDAEPVITVYTLRTHTPRCESWCESRRES